MKIKEILTGEKKDKLFLLGNEAAVRGALESGVAVASTYPGTPSSEIGNVLSVLAEDAGIGTAAAGDDADGIPQRLIPRQRQQMPRR